jgi:hypothetical protein
VFFFRLRPTAIAVTRDELGGERMWKLERVQYLPGDLLHENQNESMTWKNRDKGLVIA